MNKWVVYDVNMNMFLDGWYKVSLAGCGMHTLTDDREKAYLFDTKEDAEKEACVCNCRYEVSKAIAIEVCVCQK